MELFAFVPRSQLPSLLNGSTPSTTWGSLLHVRSATHIIQSSRVPQAYLSTIGVFALGITKTAGKNYFVASKQFRMQDLASTFTRLTGQPAVYNPITMDEWADMASRAVGPGFKEDIRQMMEWFSIAPEDKRCYGALEPADDVAQKELGLEGSTFEDWLKRSNWAGP